MKYIFGIILLFLLGCSNLTQEITEKFENGEPKTIQFFKITNSTEYLVKELQYYEGGQLAYQKQFKYNKPNGEWIFWYKNGNIWSHGFYKTGIRTGKAKVYHENGQLFFTGEYVDGSKDGEWLFYNKEGELETKTVFDIGVVVENWNANRNNNK